MKTTYTIAAIAMFTVILGMGVLAPAMASKPVAGENHKIEFCHYQEAKEAVYELVDDVPTLVTPAVLEDYLVIETDKKGKTNGHFKGDPQVAHHFPVDEITQEQNGQGDFVFTNVDEENNPTVDNDSEADCIDLHKELYPDTTP
jgi:hypothetical protein